MATTSTIQDTLLAPARLLLDSIARATGSDPNVERLQVLESCAATIGGWNLDAYRKLTGFAATRPTPQKAVTQLLDCFDNIPIHPSIALSVLATADQSHQSRRSNGCYYTDFRLAAHLAEALTFKHGTRLPLIVDPAVGTGILLVAATLALIRKGFNPDQLLSTSVHGVDLSPLAIRGCLLALSSITGRIQTIGLLRTHLHIADSLTAPDLFWSQIAPDGFDAAIANPPWERLKLNVHEHIRSINGDHHYGRELLTIPNASEFGATKRRIKHYTAEALTNTSLQGRGETDLYKLFLELAQDLVRPGGIVAMLVPAGLIRSQGTESLRRGILQENESIALEVLDNKARFFAIDTRFKFLILRAKRKTARQTASLILAHSDGTPTGVARGPQVTIPVKPLTQFRADLSVPEIRTEKEWKLFAKISHSFQPFGAVGSAWSHRYFRELDMTMDRPHFTRSQPGVPPATGHFPVIEGRMVHQFHYGAKRYVTGSGRSAVWEAARASSVEDLQPQFTIHPARMKPETAARAEHDRVGFCDITGQTNERTMLASLIPRGSMCGNKVPTLHFHQEGANPDLLYIWLALVNSFTFDWMLRRLVTTTVNFFILDSVPMPLPQSTLMFAEMAEGARRLSRRELEEGTEEYASCRADLDALAAQAYGITTEDLELILQDFDLLDRGQPSLPDDPHPTITKDLFRLAFAQRSRLSLGRIAELQERVASAIQTGACGYLPSQWGRNVYPNAHPLAAVIA